MPRLPHLAALLLGALLAALLAACEPPAAPPAEAQAGSGQDLLPNYRDRGIVVVEGAEPRPNFWEFDRVPYGEKPVHVFRLKNLDPEPVTFRELQPSCGCLQPVLRIRSANLAVRGMIRPDSPRLTLPPGGEAELELTMDTTQVEHVNRHKLGWVRIVCDSKTTPFLAFEAHIIVQRDFLCVPAAIQLGEVPQGYAKRARGDVSTEQPDCAARVLGIERIEGPLTATLDETEVGARKLWILLVDAREDLPLGPLAGKVVLKTTGNDGTGSGPEFAVNVVGQVVGRIGVRPGVVRFAKGAREAEALLECRVPGEKVGLKGVRVAAEAGVVLKAEWSAAEKDEAGRARSWTLRFQVEGELPAAGFATSAVLELDDEGMPELVVPVASEAR